MWQFLIPLIASGLFGNLFGKGGGGGSSGGAGAMQGIDPAMLKELLPLLQYQKSQLLQVDPDASGVLGMPAPTGSVPLRTATNNLAYQLLPRSVKGSLPTVGGGGGGVNWPDPVPVPGGGGDPGRDPGDPSPGFPEPKQPEGPSPFAATPQEEMERQARRGRQPALSAAGLPSLSAPSMQELAAILGRLRSQRVM